MSLKPLVEPECGQQNALLRITSQVVNDSVGQSALLPSTSKQRRPHEQLAEEYFSQLNARAVAPRSFSMHSLVREIGGVGESREKEWTEEFLHSNPPQTSLADAWTRDFVAHQSAQVVPYRSNEPLTDAWSSATAVRNQSPVTMQWTSDYLSSVEGRLSEDPAQVWQHEYEEYRSGIERDRLASAWKEEEQKEDFWNHLESEWDSLASTGEHEWLNEYPGVSSLYKDYTFEEENPYLDVSDPLGEGKGLLSQGELAKAILHFEAAVQQMPNSSEAWQYLGVTQAENEQEPSAISALKRCLELEPGNQDALFALSTAYCNESLYNDAAKALAGWLSSNPAYSHLVPQELKDPRRGPVASFLDRSFFASVEETFLKAAASQPGNVDPALQNSLGVLYNLSGNFDRAVESLQAALHVKPDDARLWNRLGATLANSNKSAEAVAAYSKALELYPGFVRARYNLGISCLNLKSNREAIEHFLSALSLQQRGIGPTAKQNMSESIWNTLRVATMHFSNRSELLEQVDRRDFDGFSRAFHVGDKFGRGESHSSGGTDSGGLRETPGYLG